MRNFIIIFTLSFLVVNCQGVYAPVDQINTQTNSLDKISHFSLVTIKDKKVVIYSEEQNKVGFLRKGDLVLLDNTEVKLGDLDFLPVLLPEGKLFLASNVNYKVEEPSFSFLSLMNFLYNTWAIAPFLTILNIENKTSYLYELYAFIKPNDTTFRETYSISDYLSELETLLKNSINSEKFDCYTQSNTKGLSYRQVPLFISSLRLNPNFSDFIYVSPKPSDKIVHKARISLNMKPEYVIKMMKYLRDNLDDTHVENLKMTSYNEFNERKDNIILYVDELTYAYTFAKKLGKAFLKEYPNSFNIISPVMMDKVSDGVFVGEEVPRGYKGRISFGKLRCIAITNALQEMNSSEGLLDDFLCKVQKEFKNVGLDFYHPHLNLNEK